jgi:hypothetical protein
MTDIDLLSRYDPADPSKCFSFVAAQRSIALHERFYAMSGLGRSFYFRHRLYWQWYLRTDLMQWLLDRKLADVEELADVCLLYAVWNDMPDELTWFAKHGADLAKRKYSMFAGLYYHGPDHVMFTHVLTARLPSYARRGCADVLDWVLRAFSWRRCLCCDLVDSRKTNPDFLGVLRVVIAHGCMCPEHDEARLMSVARSVEACQKLLVLVLAGQRGGPRLPKELWWLLLQEHSDIGPDLPMTALPFEKW